ncbi:LacI family DNA-binding transcriptional regulator [Streptomyces sp. Je 1-369]|uniref:LacI family DNA-binding transcriptional regulator n=1 Tax=Streptomyces sp. Je 1-369 TaxID=2966192 RepID=UPI002285F494|nr:LacI family DNA-binding transcriptional regulator [Streptomyces sp. Je 1-369]WAL93775.1 LacI family transcriptional regulator [Streptomyces sp. Je 1-369]
MERQSLTLEDVAREAGVSRATVSRVINGVRNVDPAIRDVVREAIERTGYAPNRAARSLVTRRTETIALVISGAGEESESERDDSRPGDGVRNAFAARVFADPFFGRVISGVVGFLRPRSMHPVLMVAESAAARKQVTEFLRQGSADGALVVSTHAEDPLPAQLVAEGLPAVCFARPALPVPISYVDLAHREGGRLAAEHLLARGRRRLATVTGPLDLPAGQERLAGFREALERAGTAYVPIAEGAFTRESGAAAMAELLAEHPGLDGVFVANDLMAQGVCELLRERGGEVPQEVAVVGFDDSSVALTCRPPLTTVRQPVEEMAAAMARLLHEHVHGVRTEPTSLIFEPELVVRDST